MEAAIIFLDEKKPFSEYTFLLPFVSEERRDRIARMAADGDKLRSLFAELLIRYEISEKLGADFKKLEFEKNEFGKPFLVGQDGYDFSVSHSAGAVAFTGGNSAVGADIERIRPRKRLVSERFFAENEIDLIEKSENSDETFFEIWTKKEAYSKMLGKGLAAGFNSFDVTDEALGCEFYTEIKYDYVFSVCSREKFSLSKIAEMTESEFLQKLSERLDFTLY